MNGIPREDVPPALRRGRGLAGGDDGLDLFSRTRHIQTISSDRESNGRNESSRSEGVSVGSAKLGRSVIDDLLSSEIGKHDYDWLLTPPGTPLVSEANDHQPPLASTRSSSKVRSVSVTKASRLSVSQTENGHSTRPTRSTSVMRPSISTTHSYNYSNNSRTSVLNTSTSSITSRPSTPGNRSTTVSSRTQASVSRSIPSRPSTPASHSIPSRPSTPASRSVPSRSSTPAKTRPSTSSNGSIARSAHSSRPTTPTGRPQISANSNLVQNSLPVRSASRPSTPTRRASAPASTPPPAPLTTRSTCVGRASTTNSRIPTPASRPSSPAPRSRPPVQPIIPPDFPLDAPPNLRTKLPERAVSAGRTRPGMALTSRVNSNTETVAPMGSNRRSSSPIVTRGRYPENTPKARVQSNGNDSTPPEIQKSVGAVRKSAKPFSATDSTGFGRTISKKSLDMALKHMDIRQHVGNIRGASIFPQSIRTAAPKGRPARMSDPTVATTGNGVALNENGNGLYCGDCNGSVSENGDMSKSPDRESLATRASEQDIYGSYRYDAILLKEDSKNMNWLHSIEDESDQSPKFDHRFESLPELFGIL